MPRTLDEYVAEDAAERIELTLGHVRTEPRDLREYDRLPLTSGPSAGAQESPWPNESARTDNSDEKAETTTPSSDDSGGTSNSSA
jgi:hypothetical protein